MKAIFAIAALAVSQIATADLVYREGAIFKDEPGI